MSSIDYSRHDEFELVEMFGRMDPRYAAAECQRLQKHLEGLGYAVTAGETGPGMAIPSSAKLEQLIGQSTVAQFDIDFGGAPRSRAGTPTATSGTIDGAVPSRARIASASDGDAASMLGLISNDLGLVGTGTLQFDGVTLWISAASRRRPRYASVAPRTEQVALPSRQVWNVETRGPLLRFELRPAPYDGQVVGMLLSGADEARRLAAMLPRRRSEEFRPQLEMDARLQADLAARAPRPWATMASVLLIIACALAPAIIEAMASSSGAVSTSRRDPELPVWLTRFVFQHGLLNVGIGLAFILMAGPWIERLYGAATYWWIFAGSAAAAALAGCAARGDYAPAAAGAGCGVAGALLAAMARGAGAWPVDFMRSTRTALGIAVVSLGFLAFHGGRHRPMAIRSLDADQLAALLYACCAGLSCGMIVGWATARVPNVDPGRPGAS